MTETTVTLGEHEVPVYAQRHAYLTNKLGKWIVSLQGMDVEGANALATMGKGSYDLLTILIPSLKKRMPLWEFEGYASAEAKDVGEYDEEKDNSPTVPQIITALQTAVEVNRFDVFKVLMKIVDPTMLRQWVNARLAEQILKSSQSSLSANGESDLTSSGPKSPTSTANAA